ncbi:hypothetical protein MRB53_005442 [Persea americana]|uniref:Uncharacterized protein n=1 Tax=Persea americana TaxID=3435 RepID=A0ACC2MEC8_PERAE|nr:hypothetical protein MRB53_005442 [Persea americana]
MSLSRDALSPATGTLSPATKDDRLLGVVSLLRLQKTIVPVSLLPDYEVKTNTVIQTCILTITRVRKTLMQKLSALRASICCSGIWRWRCNKLIWMLCLTQFR